MGVTGSCYDRESDHQHTNMDQLNEKYSELNEQYQSEREQKTNLLTKIKESTKKYDELMNSQMLLNGKYEKEIVRWQSKAAQLESLAEKEIVAASMMNISDEYKDFQNVVNSPHNESESEQYKQQINELNKQISLSNDQHNQLSQEINKLNEEIKSLQVENEKKKRRSVSFADTVRIPVPVNDEMIITSLKVEVRNLKKKLREYETDTNEDDNYNDDKNNGLLNAITPGTKFHNIVLKRYQTEFEGNDDSDDSDDSDESDESKKTDKRPELYNDSDEDDEDDESSLEEHEKIEIAQRQSARKRQSKIEQEVEEMKQQLHALSQHSINLGVVQEATDAYEELPLVSPKHLFSNSQEWEKNELKKLKKEMGQQMVHLMKEAISSDKLETD